MIAVRLFSAVDQHFAHWQGACGIDFDEIFSDYLQKISLSSDRKAFGMATIELLASLRNGHTDYSDHWLSVTHGCPFGFYATDLGARWIVTVTSDPRIELGDEVIALDDFPVEEFYHTNRSRLCSSTDRAARTLLFGRSYLFPDEFTVILKGAGEIRCAKTSGSQATQTVSPSPTLRYVSGTPVLAIPSFAVEEHERVAIEMVNSAAEQKALVVDVRGNRGGNTPMNLIEALMDRPYRLWTDISNFAISSEIAERQLRFPSHRGDRHARSQIVTTSPRFEPVAGAFAGRLVVLVDQYSHSATEDFLLPMSQDGRATLIGDCTAGSSGQPFIEEVAEGMILRVSTKRHLFPDGSPFEGVGFTPTIRQPKTAEDVVSGFDRALETAIELAQTSPSC